MSQRGSAKLVSIEYDSRLIEEAVLERVAGRPEEDQFRRSRDRIYDVNDIEDREKRFGEFHASWFARLRLEKPLRASLEEQPVLLREVPRCCVLAAVSSQEEGADLHELRDSLPQNSKTQRAILVKLKPSRFLDPAGLQALLRHELMHIADLLDPGFAYEPSLQKSEALPPYDNLIRDRYRVLWDTWIDGRLTRRGWAAKETREKRLAEFAATFAVSEEQARQKFEELFDSSSQTHAGLLALALDPGMERDPLRGAKFTQPCPLCRFPTYQLLHLATGAIRGEIARDFPDWKPEHGLCLQCADLYGARHLSRAAEAALPRI